MRYLPIMLVALMGCIEPYSTDFPFFPGDVVVIDGRLDATARSITVKLSRPQAINDEAAPPIVPGADVALIGSRGLHLNLIEERPGIYSTTNVPVNYDEKYNLDVTLNDGRKFISDPVEVLRTPQIDLVTYDFTNDERGIEILLNTHDESGKAKYFGWDYVETYEYTSLFESHFTFINKIPEKRAQEDQVYRCWRTAPSFSIGIATTRDLTASTVYRYPVLSIPGGSLKLSIRYSVLINQRVISPEEFIYLKEMKKTTEQLGDFFGPLPTTAPGNFHEVGNASSTVLGFFSASEITKKRIFINYKDLPETLQIPQGFGSCQAELTCDQNPNRKRTGPESCLNPEILTSTTVILDRITHLDSIFYSYTKRECADCRSHGGVTTKPDFW
ncbi:MAG TPA: DUF4249 domain-containing protein [Cyclobacteriaceae bacterium]|nr:DUF4249 domain-containing protein [Cyclobacteriaceae bacterium]